LKEKHKLVLHSSKITKCLKTQESIIQKSIWRDSSLTN